VPNGFVSRDMSQIEKAGTASAGSKGVGKVKFVLACDSMFDLEGCIKPALFLAEALIEKGYEISIVSPVMSRNVEAHLRSMRMGAQFKVINIIISTLK